MRCAKCNKHIPSNSKTCPHCGERIINKDAPAEISPDAFDAPVKWTIHDTYAIVGYGICFISGGLFSPIGIIFSLLSLKAKQKHRWISFWGLASNIFFITLWISLLIVFLVSKQK